MVAVNGHTYYWHERYTDNQFMKTLPLMVLIKIYSIIFVRINYYWIRRNNMQYFSLTYLIAK